MNTFHENACEWFFGFFLFRKENCVIKCVFLLLLQSSNESETEPETQSIYLEGALPHESQILVSDSQTTPEGVYDEEINGNPEEPAVNIQLIQTLHITESQLFLIRR